MTLWREDVMMALAIIAVLLAHGWMSKSDMEDHAITYKHVIEIDARKAQLLDSRPPGGCPGEQWIAQGDGETTDWACVSADLRARGK